MFEGFETLDVKTEGVRIHGRHGGNGPPLLLLHGNPMTHVTWHKLVPELSQHFHAICLLAFAICAFKSCQKACARMLLSSMAEFDFSGTKRNCA